MINAISTKTHPTTTPIDQQQPFTVVSSNPLEQQLQQALREPRFSSDTITQADVKQYLDNSAYAHARVDYEKNLLTLPGMVAHARNTMLIHQQIRTLRSTNSELNEEAFQILLGEKLPDILISMKENKQLDLAHYKAKSNHKHGYGKYLLYSNPSTSTPCCLQLFVFLPRQAKALAEAKEINHQRGHRTTLHNHIAPCVSHVIEGTLEETLYRPIEGFRKNAPLAVETKRKIRETGSAEGFDQDELNTVHRLENIGNTTAISVHYYRETDGIQTETERAAGLRNTAADMTDKANVATQYRAFKDHKPAEPVTKSQ